MGVCMGISNCSFDEIKRWSHGEFDMDFFDEEYIEDPDLFDMYVSRECGDAGLFEIISNPGCRERFYFANLLALSLCGVYRLKVDLPFHFSRLLGIKAREVYEQEIDEQADRIYKKCLIIDGMSNMSDPAIKSFYKQILDFRHDQTSCSLQFYRECQQRLDLSLFENHTSR